MPDYTFMRWDEKTFSLAEHPLAESACRVRKFALTSDICRYNVLAHYGGIYLDTDVELFQRLDQFMDCNFFSAIELYEEFEQKHIADLYLNPDGTPKDPSADVPHLEILTSTMGCAPGNELITSLRNYYNAIPPSDDWALNYRQHVNNDRLVARHLVPYGFRYVDQTQRLADNMVVYATGTFGYAFCPNPNCPVSYHHNAATWDIDSWSRTQRMDHFMDILGLKNTYQKLRQMRRKLISHE